MKKKVLIFALTYYPKFVGGDGVAVKEITDRINSDQFEFDMVTLRLDSTLPKQEKIGNINIHRVGISKDNPTPEELVKFPMYLAKIFFPITAFFKALSLHKKRKYDLFWGMMIYSGFPIVFLNFFYRKVPILLTLQDGDPVEVIRDRLRIKIVFPIFKRIFKIPNHVQAISKYLENFARELGYKGESSVVPNGVDYLKFSTYDTEKVEYIRKKQFTSSRVREENVSDPFILFTASRLVEKNGNDLVIKALAKLPENVKFIIAGTGPDREKLEKLAEEHNLEKRVIFLGHINQDDLPNFLKASDAFIRPSRTEGFGNSFVEAMAAGIPVIATTAGGIKDFLVDEVNGLEVGIDDVDDIVKQVNRLVGDSVLKDLLTENAREMVREKYDWDIVTEQMKEILHLSSLA
jgi:glycosyltransferase involved in cell wall biosynthesis